LRLPWASATLPATTVIATTSNAGSLSARISATASSEAVSVSISSGVGMAGLGAAHPTTEAQDR
jgi:hypothetical protein